MSRGRAKISLVRPGVYKYRRQYFDPRTGRRRSSEHTVYGSLTDAQRDQLEFMAARDEGRVDEFLGKVEGQTVQAFMQAWLPRQKVRDGIRDVTLLHYAELMERHVLPVVGDIPLEHLRKEDVQQVLDPLREAGLRCTAARTRAVFGLIVQSAVRDNILAFNPVRATEPIAYVRAPVTPMSSKELGAFLRAARRRPRIGLFFRLSVATGLRPSEQAALMWGDVDFENGTVSVRRSIRWIGKGFAYYPPKTAHSRRTIGIPQELVEELAEVGARRNKRALVFQTANARPHDPRNLRRYFKHTLAQAGLLHDDQVEGDADHVEEAVVPDERILEEMGRRKGFRLYDLRHTHASHLLKDNKRLLDVSRRLGHASVAFTLDTYGHVLSEMQSELVDSSAKILSLEEIP